MSINKFFEFRPMSCLKLFVSFVRSKIHTSMCLQLFVNGDIHLTDCKLSRFIQERTKLFCVKNVSVSPTFLTEKQQIELVVCNGV